MRATGSPSGRLGPGAPRKVIARLYDTPNRTGVSFRGDHQVGTYGLESRTDGYRLVGCDAAGAETWHKDISGWRPA